MLSVRDLHAGYSGKSVLHGVSLEVPRGKIVTLLGANGAGKSTLLKAIVGLLTRTAGTVELDAVPLSNATPDRALKAGVALVPEQREEVSARQTDLLGHVLDRHRFARVVAHVGDGGAKPIVQNRCRGHETRRAGR